uniref:Protein kinase domain-containing protein n=1 Tax=Davidia involucrata TaxID=16924 RepID=A0A5B7B3V7_DAVIN
MFLVKARAVTALHSTIVWWWWLLLNNFILVVCHDSVSSNIYCLRSIKDSLEDPLGYLSSWDFEAGFICKFTGVECWKPDENRVMNIYLSGMGLEGQFPSGLANCTALTGLDLSRNKLSGPIPSEISQMLPYVTTLGLSANSFSGEIPSSVANCTYLNLLKLDHNQLMGPIPPELGQLRRLKWFSVANNLLSGPVPTFVDAKFSNQSYANNSGLFRPPPKHSKRISDDKAFFISGFVVGWPLSMILVLLFIFVGIPTIRFRIGLPVTIKKMIIITRNNNKINQVAALQDTKWPATNDGRKISMCEKLVTRMSFAELTKATSNFSTDNVIGMGNTGTMYKALLPNGCFLAIKRFQHFEEQFVTELMTLGRLRHSNLVPLIGFYFEMDERLLVYKYMSNGNLYDFLHSASNTISWALRVKIAVGLSRGLAWLHHNCNFQVAHQKISSKCILLDQNFEPMISNFGEAMFMNPNHDTTSSNTNLYSINDVYGFGIVLLELVTGEEVTNSPKIFDLGNSSGLYSAVDKSLIGQGFDAEIFQFLRVACSCVQSLPDQRPSMREVYTTMRAIGERHGLTDDSEIVMEFN